MALRDQSVPFSKRTIFVAGNTKEKESTARPRACRATKNPCPLKGVRALRVSARRHRKDTPFFLFLSLSLSLSLSLFFKNRVAKRMRPGTRRENLSRTATQTIRYQMAGSRSHRVQCHSNWRLIVGRSHRGKVESCGRFVWESIPSRFHLKLPPSPDRTILPASRRDQDVRFPQTQNYPTIWRTFNERQSIWRPTLCVICKLVQMLDALQFKEFKKKKIEGDII